MLERLRLATLVAVAAAAGIAIGLALAQGRMDHDGGVAPRTAAGGAAGSGRHDVAGATPDATAGVRDDDEAVAAAAVAAAIVRLDALERRRDERAAAALRGALLEAARSEMGAARPRAARRIVDALREHDVADSALLQMAADVAQMEGRLDDAVALLYEAVHAAFDGADSARARTSIRVLTDAMLAGHAQRGEVAALRALLERLLLLDPLDDRYRMLAAEWAWRDGDAASARAHLHAMQDGGEHDAQRQQLVQRLAAHAAAVPLWRDGDHFLVDVHAGEQDARLLVDTGASLSTLTAAAAARLGAVDTGGRVDLVTAGGRVDAAVHVLPTLRVGGAELHDVRVAIVELDGIAADGLLGSDVLMRRSLRIDPERALLWLDAVP
jgi:clan AA aspartic protease (TIGR02281 family)